MRTEKPLHLKAYSSYCHPGVKGIRTLQRETNTIEESDVLAE